MRLVITGALGFIGQNLARYIRASGMPCDLIGVDRYSDAPEAERAVFDKLHIGCFASDAGLALAASADAVVHLAAQASVTNELTTRWR